MLLISYFLFSAISTSMFGGVMTSETFSQIKKQFGDDFSPGQQFLNFNDFGTSFYAITLVIFQGWSPITQYNLFSDKKFNKMFYEFY